MQEKNIFISLLMQCARTAQIDRRIKLTIRRERRVTGFNQYCPYRLA